MKRLALAAALASSAFLTGCASTAPIIPAAASGQTDMVKKYLEQGADPNAECSSKFVNFYSPLSDAALGGHNDTVKLLLEHGANPNKLFLGHGRTPLMFAASAGNDAAVKMMLEKGGAPRLATAEGETAITIAESERHESTARLLETWGQKPAEPEQPAAAKPADAAPAPAEKPWYAK